MKNYKNLSVFVLLFGFASCSPKFYTPNTQNVPLISKKGEANVTVSGNANQIEFQGAYGIANHIAIKVDGGLFIPADLDTGNGGSGKFVEVGAGYFKPIGATWVFETYGILGFGSFENHLPSTTNDYPQTNGDISATILRVGIQPNFGYKTKYFSAAVSSRLVSLSYNNIKGDLVYDTVNQPIYLNKNSSYFLVEPALTIRGGFEHLKLQLQVGYSANLTDSSFRQDNAFSTVGISYNFK